MAGQAVLIGSERLLTEAGIVLAPMLRTATDRLETAGLAPGIYLLKADDGATARLAVK